MRERDTQLEEKVKEFFSYMDIWECSDSGNWFRPNYVSSVRCLQAPKINEIILEMRELVGLPPPPPKPD